MSNQPVVLRTTNNQALTYGANCWPAQKAIAGTACAFATDFTSLLILRFIQGISGPSLGTLNVTLIGNLYEGNQRARAMGYNASVLSIVFGFAQGINIPSVLTLLTHQTQRNTGQLFFRSTGRSCEAVRSWDLFLLGLVYGITGINGTFWTCGLAAFCFVAFIMIRE